MRVKTRLLQLLWVFFLFFWTLVVLILVWGSLRHFAPWKAPSIFLQSRTEHYAYFLPALYLHIFSSPLVLLLGSWSLWPALRSYSSRLHRLLGKSYDLLILLGAAPSGFVMAFLALGGWAGRLCFLLLSFLWAGMTWRAWRLAVQGNWEGHQAFMWRSFALTTSAFFLRFFSFLGAYYWQLQGADVYVLFAWGSWLFPLILVELLLRYRKRASTVL